MKNCGKNCGKNYAFVCDINFFDFHHPKNKCLGVEEGWLGMFTQLTMTLSLDRMVTNGRNFF